MTLWSFVHNCFGSGQARWSTGKPAHTAPDTIPDIDFRLPVDQARGNRQAPLRVGSGRENRFLSRASARLLPIFTPCTPLPRTCPTAGRAAPSLLCLPKCMGISKVEQEGPPEGGKGRKAA